MKGNLLLCPLMRIKKIMWLTRRVPAIMEFQPDKEKIEIDF
jgi:hypothetical protein